MRKVTVRVSVKYLMSNAVLPGLLMRLCWTKSKVTVCEPRSMPWINAVLSTAGVDWVAPACSNIDVPHVGVEALTPERDGCHLTESIVFSKASLKSSAFWPSSRAVISQKWASIGLYIELVPRWPFSHLAHWLKVLFPWPLRSLGYRGCSVLRCVTFHYNKDFEDSFWLWLVKLLVLQWLHSVLSIIIVETNVIKVPKHVSAKITR